jgi:hypothetical protein
MSSINPRSYGAIATQTVEAMRQSGVEMLDIPAFLRKQAD